jgi:hypothetical protein
MAAINSAVTGPVIPAGYYTSQGLQSLSLSQQAAANGQQAFLTSRQNLFNSLFATAGMSSPTALGIQINGASSPGQLAAQAGSVALQESQSNLLGSITATAGWAPTSIFQLNLQQTLAQSGLLGYSQESPTPAQSASTGALDSMDNRQALVNSLANPSSSEGTTALSAYLSGLYNQTSQSSLVPRGSNVGGNLNATA